MERLDKILGNLGYGSRKEIKGIVKKKLVEVDGDIAKDSSMQVDVEKNIITINGERIIYRKYIYLMMNKPQGVVSATFDNYDETVIDLLQPEHQLFSPFPIGRLDKDTVGLLLITNDGELNHRLISPKWHVDKVYFAKINKEVNEEDIIAFKDGVILDDDYKCMPSTLEILKCDENGAEVKVILQEGKFHQVKRMFKSRNKEVVFLKRIIFAGLPLDTSLEEGSYRELTEEELRVLKNI
jgi:16S rRNA pseudouridine516 synthase